ncbi:hypothetical protein VNO78_14324 [Psophocarpus tetragonolobus]|uniref:Uncharacterized protein n=1 Tax=Psophocarpus tetragonolobus TaxID=3891 RepID=A0AAN9SYN9_PSOTE
MKDMIMTKIEVGALNFWLFSSPNPTCLSSSTHRFFGTFDLKLRLNWIPASFFSFLPKLLASSLTWQ